LLVCVCVCVCEPKFWHTLMSKHVSVSGLEGHACSGAPSLLNPPLPLRSSQQACACMHAAIQGGKVGLRVWVCLTKQTLSTPHFCRWLCAPSMLRATLHGDPAPWMLPPRAQPWAVPAERTRSFCKVLLRGLLKLSTQKNEEIVFAGGRARGGAGDSRLPGSHMRVRLLSYRNPLGVGYIEPPYGCMGKQGQAERCLGAQRARNKPADAHAPMVNMSSCALI